MDLFYQQHEGLIQTIAFFVALIIAYYTFFKPIFDFIRTQKRIRQDKRFKSYHDLIDIFVGAQGAAMLDRQIAIAFELRSFPEYFKVTKRILEGLKAQWNVPGNAVGRLITEMDFTIEYIESNYFKRLFCSN